MTTVNESDAERERTPHDDSGSPVYPAALTGPDCGCPVSYSVTRCQHGEYACNLCNVEHRASCPLMQVTAADEQALVEQLRRGGRGPAYVVDPREMVGLPAPDFGATAERASVIWATSIAEPGDPDLELVLQVRQIIFEREQLNPREQRDDAARRIIALVRDADRRVSHEGATVSALTAERFGPVGGDR